MFGRSSEKDGFAWEEPEAAARVSRQIRAQRTFTRGYSKLYSALLDCALAWLNRTQACIERLGSDSEDKIRRVGQNVIHYAATSTRSSLEDSLGFAAALHSFVLADDARVSSLAPYYASVGGDKDCQEPAFEQALLDAVAGLDKELFERASLWRVQTNETSRGITWLLPVTLLGLEGAHLIELGASAGLNLYAEQRRYELLTESGACFAQLGQGQARAFCIPTQFAKGIEPTLSLPEAPLRVHSRIGADFAPVDLAEAPAHLHLKACIWPDQPERLQRLQEGIEIHEKARAGALEPAAQLLQAELPSDLQSFLNKAMPSQPQAPAIIYNTYVTEYFNDVQERALTRALREYVRRWSMLHEMPAMWVRFEPPRKGEPLAPRRGWCRWDLELFTGSKHQVLHLGWAHPHFKGLILESGFAELALMVAG